MLSTAGLPGIHRRTHRVQPINVGRERLAAVEDADIVTPEVCTSSRGK